MKDMLLNSHVFMLNSLALGDVIATAPVIKYMVDRYHKTPKTYTVCAKPMFRPLFPFVPDEAFTDFDNKDNWRLPPGAIMSILNEPRKVGVTRGTPKNMTLGQFASIRLADRILSPRDMRYVPLQPVDISHFALPKPYAVFVSTYRDETRSWPADQMLPIAEWLQHRGITPVFIGKTDMNLETPLTPKTSLPADVSEYGIDLRNKTSIPELASIMGQAVVVMGVDSGPIHLAGTTGVPIICGYTSVLAEHRVPNREHGRTYAITPEVECIGCESNWCSHTHNFELCYLKHANCIKYMTADLFMKPLKKLLRAK